MKVANIISVFLLLDTPVSAAVLATFQQSTHNFTIAEFQAKQEIEKQLLADPRLGLAFESKVIIDNERMYDYDIEYYNDIKCNSTFQGQEITGLPSFNFRMVDRIPCSTKKEMIDGKYSATVECNLSDDIIKEINDLIKSGQFLDDRYFCENHFKNTFIKNGRKTKVQKGVIYGRYSYKDFYDKGGKFYKLKDGTYIGNAPLELMEEIKTRM